MRRWRMMTAGVTGIVLGAGLALGGASSASAEPNGHWGTFTLSGASRAYTGTMTLPGFPETTFTSTSRQSTVVSGASTWQGPSTGPGAVYGSSRNSTYLNQRPTADTASGASTTTYTFATPTPGASSWSFVLGDVDADQATISATTQGGGTATAAQLGFQGSYNSCSSVSPGGWSCPADPGGVPAGQDVPTWDPATRTLTGNPAANDTAGATAWFTPTVPLDSLTITYQQRSGFPVYQTWFANRTAAISGVATLDGTAIPGATVTVTALRGTSYTTTTDAEGRYVFPQLPVINGYRVDVAAPSGATGTASVPGVSLNTAPGGVDRTVDFPFVSPPDTTSAIGTVTDGAGHPAADVPVVITDPDEPDVTLVDTVTNSDGVYTASDLPASTDLVVTVGDEPPVTITTGASGTPPVPQEPIAAPSAVAAVTGTVTIDGAPVPARVVVELLDVDGVLVASTQTDGAGAYRFAAAPGAYTVRTTTPEPGATGAVSAAADTTAGDAVVDFPFATPQAPAAVVVDQPGTVTDPDGGPVAGVTVVATPTEPDSGAAVSTTTGPDGGFVLVGLERTTSYEVVAGTGATAGAPQTIVTPESGAAAPLALVVRAAAVPSPTPTSAPTASPSPTPTVAPVPSAGGGAGTVPVSSTGVRGGDGALAYTGADVLPAAIAAGVLVLLGAGLLTFRAVRNRRRTEHLQD